MAIFPVQTGIGAFRHPRMRQRQLRRRYKNCGYVRQTEREHSSYQAVAIGRYLDERDLESPWSPLPLGDHTEDNRSFHRDREVRVAIDRCSIGNSSSNSLSGKVERLGEVNLGGTSRSPEWIRVRKVEYGPPRFTFENVAEASLVDSDPLVAEDPTPVVANSHGREKMLLLPNFVECELEYTAEAGWMKVAVWSR